MNKILKKIAKYIIELQPSKEISDKDLEYLLWICSLYVQISPIPGHIAEVGVASGRNTVLFGHLIKLFGDTSVRQYIGFDTFDGYVSEDLIRDKHLDKNRWKKFTMQGVLNRCESNHVSEYIELFQGDASIIIPEILAKHSGKKFQPGKGIFALVYIDCNAFRPAINSMRAFLPYMIPGSIFAIDEKMQGGESEALVQFAKENKLILKKPGSMQVPMTLQI